MSPGRIVAILLAAVMKALAPYVTIWFSAQLINELAGLRRPEILTRWALLTVGLTAVMALLSAAADGWERFTDHMHNPCKNRLFTRKFFRMDYASLDNQEVRDLFAQIVQNENWNGWGINQAIEDTKNTIQSVMGILGAAALTVSLFTQPVPPGPYAWLNSPLLILEFSGNMAFVIWFGTSREDRIVREFARLAEKATLGNRLYDAMYRMSEDSRRRLDICTYNQQNMVNGFLEHDAFSPGGVFDRLATSFLGIMNFIGQASSALFTGSVYVFTCLKAWAGAFSVGSVTQYVGAATALSGNITLLLKSINSIRSNASFLEKTYAFLDLPNAMY